VIGVKPAVQKIEKLYVKVTGVDRENPLDRSVAPTDAQPIGVDLPRQNRVGTSVLDTKLLGRKVDQATKPSCLKEGIHPPEIAKEQPQASPRDRFGNWREAPMRLGALQDIGR
jgi:hypothetical protein